MIECKDSDSLLGIVRKILETGDSDLIYMDVNKKKHIINCQHLLDLFIAGVPNDISFVSLLELSPALKQGEKLELSHQLLVNIIRRFVIIFDSLHDGIIIADENEIVRYLNKAFERITNAKFDKVAGQIVSQVRPGKLAGVIKSGIPIFGVTRRFEGTEYITDIHPIISNNVHMGGITVARDITEVRQLQTQLLKYKDDYHDLLKQTKGYKAIYTFDDIIGGDKELIKAKNIGKKIAKSKIPVLIRGESGTGKELFAHALHLESNRANQPFVTVNCAAIPDNLLESELFGYSDGAFSGAKKSGKQGLMMLANKGTLFLDEIGDMNIDLQAKLLRAINSGEIHPLGSESSINVDVRIIAATNANLEKRINQNKFREDLYYRLNVSQLFIPSLRERSGDILKTARYFLDKHFANHSLAPLEFSSETENIFLSFRWPGNVRELENTIVFIGNITESNIISPNYLPSIFYEGNNVNQLSNNNKTERNMDLRISKNNEEKKIISEALDKYGRGVKSKKIIAAELGISLATLYNKMNILGIK